MASRHVRWVLARRDRYADEIDRDIMITIASHIGQDDSPAELAIATIAKYAGCHYNTADKRTKVLQAAGELVIEKKGRYLTYNIPSTADDQGQAGDAPGPATPPDSTTGEDLEALRRELKNLRDDVKALTSIVTSLSHDLHMNVTSPSHDLHMTFTPDQTDNVNKEVKKGSKKKGRRTDPPQAPPWEPESIPTLPGAPLEAFDLDAAIPPGTDFPENLRDREFVELWQEYERHRDQMGKPLSIVSRQKQLDKAASVGRESACWVINQTLENGWTGLIWERLSEQIPRASPTNQPDHDPLADRKRRIEERLKREGLA